MAAKVEIEYYIKNDIGRINGWLNAKMPWHGFILLYDFSINMFYILLNMNFDISFTILSTTQ